MSPKDCAYIVERLAIRFMALVAEHERQLSEHRTSFGARTEADAKIIARLQSENVAARMAGLERDSLMSERNGLLTQVQDMRAEMQRLSAQLDWERAEIKRLQWENLTMHKDAEDGYAEAIKVLGDPIALSKERDALRAEVAALKSQTPKQSHPVAVGGYLRRLTGFNTTPAGEVARVTLVDDDDASHLEYEVVRPNGQRGRWSATGCEPCDPPATIKREPKIGDTVRLVTVPTRDAATVHLRTALKWPWIDRWGVVGQTGKVVKPLVAVDGAVAVDLDNSTIFAQWPIACLEVVAEATHDTEAGKAAAESALTTEPVADEIKVGDVVEVFQKTGSCTFETDIGTRGTVLQLDSCVDTAPLEGYRSPKGHHVDLCDVRKVTT